MGVGTLLARTGLHTVARGAEAVLADIVRGLAGFG